MITTEKCKDWMNRWDKQQNGYMLYRELRFDAMLEVLDAMFEGEFTVLDIACGPGSISQRVLSRFPKARSVALDFDPVLLTIGQKALGTMDRRLRWVEADLTQPDWVEKLGESQFDAVLSTTALHWLPTNDLLNVYMQLGNLVRPGGVFLNGDHIGFASHLSSFQNIAETVRDQRKKKVQEQQDIEDWEKWWEALKRDSDFADLIIEQERRFPPGKRTWKRPIYDIHAAALRDANFREVGIIWQNMDNRVVMAIR